MLLELEVSGFALVDHLVLEFEAGLTVLTGETGAGKSIVLDSLSFLLATAQRTMTDEQDCRVAGRFAPTPAVRDFLESQSLPVDEDELLIVRERKAGGRTTSRLNGSLVSVSQLKALSRLLVDFHGQHQSYQLTRPSTHLPMLDRLAGAPHQEELVRYHQLYTEWTETRSAMDELKGAERNRLREMEWLRLELEEIAKVDPKAGEDLELDLEIRRLAASEDIARGSHETLLYLQAEGGALETLAQGVGRLSGLVAFDPALNDCLTRLRSAEIEVAEVTRELSSYSESVEHDPTHLDVLQSRAEALKALRRKYGQTIEDVLRHRDQALETMERLEHSDQHLEGLEKRAQILATRLTASAQILTERRQKAAQELRTEVTEELAHLAMPAVNFEVEFTPLTQLAANGQESVQFLFSPNPGRPLSGLAETASGGELSRVMLALVTILSRYQRQPTLIFDEIDVGLGGRTAEAVAQRLAELARRVQILAVTHLPVVASAGDGHYVVEKVSDADSTTVTVKRVLRDDRVKEIARMLSGDSSPKTARQLATALLKAR